MTGTDAAAFWRRVDRAVGPIPPPHTDLGDLGPCWLWLGPRDRDGYGLTPRLGGEARAHRVSWVLAHGPIPPGRWVLHRCDTPGCVNPAHLFLGTTRENTADMVAKGRQARGERHASRRHPERVARGERVGTAKLTAVQVAAIRERYAAGGVSTRTLAAEYGVSRTLLKLIVRGEVWRCASR
jgi:hypothetical protein